MMLWTAQTCGCTQEVYNGHKRERFCKCGNLFVSEKVASTDRRPRSTLKRGRGFAVHPKQRAKVKDRPCIVTGQDRFEATIHPMHIWDRGRGGCDDPLCVVPGRADIHRLYDEKKLDILSALVTHGYFEEMAHVIEAHEVSPTRLIERLTCRRWAPLETTPEAVTTGCQEESSQK